MEPKYFMGIDVGTTSTKAILFSDSGAIKGIANQGYPLLSPKPGWSEQEPEAIFAAVIAAVKDVVKQADIPAREIGAIGFSTAMHSLIVVDDQHRAITNSITWADSRSVNQAERLKRDGSGFAVYQRTGTPIHPMSPLVKLLWLREQDPETFKRAAKFISIKEYILYRLFGRYVVDYSIASATGLFNLKNLSWDAGALELAGIRSEQLSELVPTTYILRGIDSRYVEATGLHPDTPVAIGASDGVLANLGVGATEPNQIAVTIGTSSAVRKVVPQPVTDRQGRTFCYALTEHQWVVGGASNSGGIVLRWFRDRFGQAEVEQAKQQGVDPYELIIQSASAIPAGAEGLLFLPFLTGERAPYWNADARGVFFGLALHHERSHMARAVLEGILFCTYSITAVLNQLTGDDHTIRASGGFARSHQWLQMMADLFGYEVLVPESHEASGFGAAVLAMHAIGALSDLSHTQHLIRVNDRYQPNPERSSQYHDLFKLYQQIYDRLVEQFSTIADYQRQFINSST